MSNQIKVGSIVEFKSNEFIGSYSGLWTVIAVQGSWIEIEPEDADVLAEERADGLGRSYGYGCGRNEIWRVVR